MAEQTGEEKENSIFTENVEKRNKRRKSSNFLMTNQR